MTTSNQTQITTQKKKDLKELLQGDAFKRELSALLPKTLSAERFVRIAFQATHRNPALLGCSQQSFFNCLLQLGAMGLEPDGRRAHLIPYGDECTLIVDYKGIKELLRRNGDVFAMHCDVVGENDQFTVRFGTHGLLSHTPSLTDRGKILCAYSYVKFPGGAEEYEVMSSAEIESIRQRSRTPNRGPWQTDWNEMAKKTVFRRHAKGLPLTPETREALDRDDDGDSLAEKGFAAARPVKANVLSKPAPEKQESEESGEPTVTTNTVSHEELVQALVKRIEATGYSHSEVLSVLKARRLVLDPKIDSLAQVAVETLQMCLEDWDNLITLLDANFGKSSK